jgi:hypothetical protein
MRYEFSLHTSMFGGGGPFPRTALHPRRGTPLAACAELARPTTPSKPPALPSWP